MRPYSRIEADVDLDEEAELRRLEDGTPDVVLGEQPLLPVMEPAVFPQLPAQMTRQLDPEPSELDKAPDACSAMLQRGVADPGVAGQLQLIGRIVTFTKSDGLEVTITLAEVENVRLGAASAGSMVAKIVMHNGELYTSCTLIAPRTARPSCAWLSSAWSQLPRRPRAPALELLRRQSGAPATERAWRAETA